MKIAPVKLIKSAQQAAIENEDWLQRPELPFQPSQSTITDFAVSNVAMSGQKLMLGGEDMGQMIAKALRENPAFLSHIANEIEKFKERQKKRARDLKSKGKLKASVETEFNEILSLCDNYLKKIKELVKTRYDQTQTGVRLSFDEDGQLFLNGMNVTMFLANCRENPTPKSKLFLKGLRSRLCYILQNKGNVGQFERLHDAVMDVFSEIDHLLAIASE